MPVPRLVGWLFYPSSFLPTSMIGEGRPSVLAFVKVDDGSHLFVVPVCRHSLTSDVAVIGSALENGSVTSTALFTRIVFA
jgi:hypothetical protein